jgi:hypothetical protein
MKKKFVLTLALVLMVAASLMAATPLEVSGSFKAGYEFTFKDDGDKSVAKAGDQASIDAVVAFTGDFWKVALASGPVDFDNDMEATASIYLDKALAAQGLDMGDLAVTLTIGNKTTLGGLSVYANTRDDLENLKMASTIDVLDSDNSTGDYASAVQVDYGTMVSVYAGADIAAFDTANKAIILSAKVAPVDGVKAAVEYTNFDARNSAGKGAIAGSVAVDVKALADLDFGLDVSAYDIFLLDADVNKLYVEAKTTINDITAWAEYRIVDKTNDLKVSASYAGIENVGLSAYVELSDLTKEAGDVGTKIGGGANYMMGGVTYALDLAYTLGADFTMTPTVKIAF